MDSFYILLLLLFVVAFVYSSVGHGGASGYLAVMAVMGIAPNIMKSSALVMNIAVSAFSFIAFYRAGYFKPKLFIPFAISSVPMAFLGGTMVLSDSVYKKILAVFILISILRLFYQFQQKNEPTNPIPIWAGLVSGGLIGLVSGMIGIGGGILLSQLMLLMRWSNLKETAAISALFIFVNSIAGLYGKIQNGGIELTENLQYGICIIIIGGLLGSHFGSTKFNLPTLRYLLTLSLSIACLKLVLT